MKILTAVGTLLVTVCLGAAMVGAKTLRMADSTDIAAMDPHSMTESNTIGFLHHVYESFGEIRRRRILVKVRLNGHTLERVHHICNVHLLRAAHYAVIARHAHPEGVTLEGLLPSAGPQHGEKHAWCVIHGVRRRA